MPFASGATSRRLAGASCPPAVRPAGGDLPVQRREICGSGLRLSKSAPRPCSGTCARRSHCSPRWSPRWSRRSRSPAGTLPRIDLIGMIGGRNRAFYSGKHKAHGLNVQVQYAEPYGHLHCAGVLRFGVRFPPRTPDQVSDQQVLADSTDSRSVCAGHRRGGSSPTGTCPSSRRRVRSGLLPGGSVEAGCSIAPAPSPGSSCAQILTAGQPAAANRVSVSRSRRAMPGTSDATSWRLVLGRWL